MSSETVVNLTQCHLNNPTAMYLKYERLIFQTYFKITAKYIVCHLSLVEKKGGRALALVDLTMNYTPFLTAVIN